VLHAIIRSWPIDALGWSSRGHGQHLHCICEVGASASSCHLHDKRWLLLEVELQVIGMHFMNPPPIMKLVEIVRGMATDDNVFATVKCLAERYC
jgi:hypothetical protein